MPKIPDDVTKLLDNPLGDEALERWSKESKIVSTHGAVAKALSSAVKDYFLTHDMSEFDNGKIKVKLDARGTVMNEERLKVRLRELGATSAIKLVEVIDADELQRLIYDQVITEQQLADCMDDKPQSSRSIRISEMRG